MKLLSVKTIKPFSLTIALTIVLAAFSLTTGYSRVALTSERADEDSRQAYRVRTLHAPGLPVRISGNIVPVGKEGMALKYSVANLTATSVHDLELAIYILDKKARVKVGQVWRLPVELSANSTENFSVRLTNEPKPGDSVVLAIQEVTQEQRTRRVNAIPFLKMANASVASSALATAQFVAYRPYEACPTDFCERQSAAADKACNTGGSCGVKTFDCDQNACSTSWTCFQCHDLE